MTKYRIRALSPGQALEDNHVAPMYLSRQVTITSDETEARSFDDEVKAHEKAQKWTHRPRSVNLGLRYVVEPYEDGK